jgi:hypothetical protein
MYSDISDMHKAANENKTLKYARSILGAYKAVEKDTIGVKYCIYGRYDKDDYYDCWFFKLPKCLSKHPRFGSLLYQIGSPHKGYIPYNTDNNPRAIQQIHLNRNNNEFVFKAKNSGILYLTFNDVLLDASILKRIHNDSINGEKAGLEMCEELKRVKIFHNKDIKDEQIWFKDNLGEVLINVRIEKSIRRSDLPWYKKPVVYLYRHLNHFATRGLVKSKAWLYFLFISVFFATDVIVSRKYKKRIKNE